MFAAHDDTCCFNRDTKRVCSITEQEHWDSANSAKAEMSTESDPRFESGLILIRIQMSAGSLPKCEFIALHGVSHFAKFRKSQRVTVRNDKKSKI